MKFVPSIDSILPTSSRWRRGTRAVTVVEAIADEGRLARAGHTGNGDELAERDRDVDVFEVVLRGTADLDMPRVGTEVAFVLDFLVAGCDPRRAGVHEASAVLAGAWTEVERVVGTGDDRRIVLDDHHRVCRIAKATQDRQQPLAVAGVKADRRLVDDVQGLGQRAAEGCGEVDALRLAAGQRPALAFEGEVRQADLIEIGQPVHDLAAQMPGDGLLLFREREVLPEVAGFLHVHAEEIADHEIAELHVGRGGLQTRPVALRARLVLRYFASFTRTWILYFFVSSQSKKPLMPYHFARPL